MPAKRTITKMTFVDQDDVKIVVQVNSSNSFFKQVMVSSNIAGLNAAMDLPHHLRAKTKSLFRINGRQLMDLPIKTYRILL